MKCLTQIIEADHEVLGMQDVRSAVNSRMMDPNAAVREATIELLGKFLLVKQEFIPKYYSILLERIKVLYPLGLTTISENFTGFRNRGSQTRHTYNEGDLRKVPGFREDPRHAVKARAKNNR